MSQLSSHPFAVLLQAISSGVSDVVNVIISSVGGGIVGFLAAWAAMRERVRSLEEKVTAIRETADRDRSDHLREMARVAKEVQDAYNEERLHFKELERRQLAMLSLQIDIANKLGVTRRLLPDAFTREEGG